MARLDTSHRNFPAEVYQFSQIPAEVVPKDVAIICIGAFLICSVAALIPAYFAARLDPVKALRFELAGMREPKAALFSYL